MHVVHYFQFRDSAFNKCIAILSSAARIGLHGCVFVPPPVPRLGWDNCVAASTLRHESAYTGACPFGRGMGPGKDLGDELVSLAPPNTKIQA